MYRHLRQILMKLNLLSFLRLQMFSFLPLSLERKLILVCPPDNISWDSGNPLTGLPLLLKQKPPKL
jgi:hypothetical protein